MKSRETKATEETDEGEKKWRSGYHSKANISFLEGGAVVGTVSCHCNHLSGFAHCAVDDAWSAEWNNKNLVSAWSFKKRRGKKVDPFTAAWLKVYIYTQI